MKHSFITFQVWYPIQNQMACSFPVENNDDFLSSKDPSKTNEDCSSSSWCSDNDEVPGLKKLWKSNEDLFRKNNSVPRNKQKMKDESFSRSMTRRDTPSIPLVPPGFHGGSRRVSFLERSLFPGIKPEVVLPAPSTTYEKSKTAQLTIFYAGAINVYDDVPLDLAEAIMLLASQSCSSHPIIKDTTKEDRVDKSAPGSHSPSLFKIQPDLPITRRQSLRRFLDKRRQRIISKKQPL